MNIINIITGAPFWAWLVLALLIYFGIRAFKAQQYSIFRLILFPLIFLYLSFTSYKLGNISLWIIVIGYLVGIILGMFWGMRMLPKIQWNPHRPKFVTLPGTRLLLILFVILFLVKFIMGIEQAINYGLTWESYGLPIAFLLQSFLTGILMGRALFVIGIIIYQYNKYTKIM